MSVETAPRTTPEATVDPETIAEIDEAGASAERRRDTLEYRATEFLSVTIRRVSVMLEKRAMNKAHGEAIKEDGQRLRDAQDEAFASYENNIAYTAEKEKLIDPRSRLRKLGDAALGKMESLGQGKFGQLLESWGIIPLRGTWHNQKGWNFSAWVARKYVKAQEARQSRNERITAGFLSPEAQAQLNEMDETVSPEKMEQDEAYETYEENIEATAKRESEEAKVAQDAAYETYTENINATAERETREEEEIERERLEAEERAREARERKEERRERRREHIASLRGRLGKARRSLGGSAMKLLRRTGSGLRSLASKVRR